MHRTIRHILILTAALVTAFSSCERTDTVFSPYSMSYGVDGDLKLQEDWSAVYLGRYNASEEAKGVEYIDRLSAEGTGDAMYYHVIAKRQSLTSNEDLLTAFRDGTGIGKTMGGKALVEWFKTLAELDESRITGLSAILACGGPDDDNGYMDYSIGSTGTYDVYVVEMLPNGHISGRYGMTVLEINGNPVK